ncbi:transposase [Aquisphaera giovannonii]|uniref:transposase n=1 Tax=Aquisphaera giovannonii TaxID=406548 RepID=UPI001FECFF5C|nr:transposase [Aquisphaera giovannonii]
MGLHITHWSSEDLARQAILDGIVSSITGRTIRMILDRVDLQPHRTRYWRTARPDERFKERAEKVLWCYANATRLAERDVWVVYIDERHNKQVLERSPIRRAVPGSTEQQEFEYTRHGTVDVLNFLAVHTGRIEAVTPEANDAGHFIPALEAIRRGHHRLRGGFLVMDGGASHIAGETADYLAGSGGW